MKNWSKFYTPKPIANQIIAMMPKNIKPAKVIDICVGSGNFLEAAMEQWNNINAIGIDISLNDINKKNKYTLHQLDALDLQLLLKKVPKIKNESKIVLANPPFGKLDDSEKYLNQKDDFNPIFNEAIKTKRIEALMLYSNLSILNEGDYFGAILPENIFTSMKLTQFKKMFIDEFDNVEIGDKEKHFSNSEVKTRTFIGRYKGNNDAKKFDKIYPNLNLKSCYTLYRGIDNSKLLSVKSIEDVDVIHFNNLNGAQNLERFFPKTKVFENLIVSKNDTLILRVGRHSGHTYSAKKEYVNKYVSDYFYLLKGIKFKTKEHQVLQNLLKNKRKGITTNYLNKIDIIDSINAFFRMKKTS